VVAAGPLGRFLDVASWVLVAVGVALLPWVSFVASNAQRQAPRADQTRLTIARDVAWVVGAAAIIAIPDTLSAGGKWALGAVSPAVAGFAYAQWRALRAA
jgi:hypothetical protein